jgi:hypothetical protein
MKHTCTAREKKCGETGLLTPTLVILPSMSLTRELPICSVGFPPTNAVPPPASQHGVFIRFAPFDFARFKLLDARAFAGLREACLHWGDVHGEKDSHRLEWLALKFATKLLPLLSRKACYRLKHQATA